MKQVSRLKKNIMNGENLHFLTPEKDGKIQLFGQLIM
jgi:hypothetical protein